jgi:hypothetical protein
MLKPIRPFIVQEEQLRRRKLIGLAVGVTAAIVLAASTQVPAPYWRVIQTTGKCIALACVVLLNGGPFLRCPSCTGLAEEYKRYCPVCGADGLERKPLAAPHCSSCDRTLARWWIRDYPIRHCTHCSVELSKEGV